MAGKVRKVRNAVKAVRGVRKAVKAVRRVKKAAKAVKRVARKAVVKRVAKTAVRKAKSARKTARKAAGKSTLTPKQRAQRKYAGSMAGIRKRAKSTAGGKGRIAQRPAATQLREDLGLQPGQ